MNQPNVLITLKSLTAAHLNKKKKKRYCLYLHKLNAKRMYLYTITIGAYLR